jgi:hypothetical protein
VRSRLPLILSVTALAVAVFGSTPVGSAATGLVKEALFARNAGKVGGISVSRTPKPNTLLPLGGDAKLPASVLPAGTGTGGAPGPAGPAGPRGPAGPEGVNHIYIHHRGDLGPILVSDRVAIRDAGRYLLIGRANVTNKGAARSITRCRLQGGDIDGPTASGAQRPGAQSGITLDPGQTAEMVVFGNMIAQGETNRYAYLICTATGGGVQSERAQIVAVSAADLDATG